MDGSLLLAAAGCWGTYEAIPYTSGDLSTTKEILCNGKIIRATVNLYAVFKRLRDSSNGLLLWADAVCIDQRNIKERGHQVKLMGQIFKNSEMVRVCLSDNDRNDVFETIKKTDKAFGI